MVDLTLDLRFLEYAFAAAEHGSIRRAANALGVPQCTISRRIQALEVRLGTALFERSPTGIRTTPAGSNFLTEARIGAGSLRRAASGVASFRRGYHGELRIGLFASLAGGLLPEVIGKYRQRFPAIHIELNEDTAQANVAGLLNRRLDAVFLTGSPCIPGCEVLRLGEERIMVAMPSEHRLAANGHVSWRELHDEPFIVCAGGPGPDIQDYLVARLSGVGFRPSITVQRVGRENLMNMVARGFGLTLETESAASVAFPGVDFRPIAGDADIVPATAIWSKHNRNPALKNLIELAKAASAKQSCVQRTAAK